MDMRDSYDAAAEAYADHLAAELEHKPLDRHLLNRFAESIRSGGLVADVGCGPGHVTKYLHDRGATAFGTDLSPNMIACARRRYPGLDFRVGDMRRLEMPTGSLAGVLCFYAIVHFAEEELAPIAEELRRVLAPGGLALFAFHIGSEILHRDELFGAPVNLDFRFHDVAAVVTALQAGRLEVVERSEREPYPDVEYHSRRCYLLTKAM